MSWIVMAITFAVLTVAGSMVPPLALFGQAKLPLLMSAVLYYALHRRTRMMTVAALAAGLLQDTLSPLPLGMSPLFFVVIGWIAGRFRGLVMVDSAVTGLFFGMASGLGVTLLQGLLLVRGGLVSVSAVTVVAKAAGTAVLGGVCTPFVFFAIGRLDRMAGSEEPDEVTHGLA